MDCLANREYKAGGVSLTIYYKSFHFFLKITKNYIHHGNFV